MVACMLAHMAVDRSMSHSTNDAREAVSFSKIPSFLDRILTEHIECICSLESELFFDSICSIRIWSINRDIFEIQATHLYNSN